MGSLPGNRPISTATPRPLTDAQTDPTVADRHGSRPTCEPQGSLIPRSLTLKPSSGSISGGDALASVPDRALPIISRAARCSELDQRHPRAGKCRWCRPAPRWLDEHDRWSHGREPGLIGGPTGLPAVTSCPGGVVGRAQHRDTLLSRPLRRAEIILAWAWYQRQGPGTASRTPQTRLPRR
jgi:hypothetical protein